MPTESAADLRLEIGHVLFIDIVGYSKLLIEEQKERLNQLTEIVLGTAPVREATDEQLVRLPTGDGVALVFRGSVEEPARCALEIAEALRKHPELSVRMGIHSGPVSEVSDVSGRSNIAGAGINMAQRVMDCGDAGHILMSQHVADDLIQYRQWAPRLHDLGDCEVKHGVRLHLVNLYAEPLGNAAVPQKFQQVAPAALVAKPARSNIGWIAALILVVIVAAALLWQRAQRSSPPPVAAVTPAAPIAPSAPDKSVAVLPFANLSSDKDNAYFAQGIQDEILTRLAKIGALKVISRTSTSHYASSPQNLPEIAKQLGVANILEGSVQKAVNAVHVNVQLIRAATDDHLWAESYDRKLDDIFSVEKEVAQNIASALNAKLSGAEEQVLAQKPTSNSAAYDAYLRGLADLGASSVLTDDALNAAAHSFEEAVRIDPQFALAWAKLCRAHSMIYFQYFDRSEARRTAAANALAEALRLQPQLPEAQLAKADFQYWVLLDYKGARDLFEQLHLSWPSNADIVQDLGWVTARLGDRQKSAGYLEQAIGLNPRDLYLRVEGIKGRLALRDFAAVHRMADEALRIWPGDARLLSTKAEAFQAAGQLDQAQKIVDLLHPGADPMGLDAIVNQARLRRTPAIAFPFFEAVAQKTTVTPSDAAYLVNFADLLELSGDKTKARAMLLKARPAAEGALKEQPDNAQLITLQAHVLAALGERDVALREIDRALRLTANDARDHRTLEEMKARMLSRLGEKDQAIALLPHLLEMSYDGSNGAPLTPALLRLDPDFDLLRGDPRFKKLCQEPNK